MTAEAPPIALRPHAPATDAAAGAPPPARKPPTATLVGDSPHGPLTIAVRLGRDLPPSRSAVAHALHAAAAELHIAFLEWWLDAFLDLRPAPSGTAPPPPLCTLAAAEGQADADGEGVSVEVSLPGASWGGLPPLEGPATEAGWAVAWERCRTSLELEDVALAPDDAARVAPGSTLLLPRSFGDGPWRATLRADRSRASRDGVYDPADSCWRDPAEGPAEALRPHGPPANAVRAMLWTCGTAPTRLFTAHDSPRALEIGPGKSRALCLLALGGERWFRGHLLPVAAGHGFLVEAPLRATRGPAAAPPVARAPAGDDA